MFWEYFSPSGNNLKYSRRPRRWIATFEVRTDSTPLPKERHPTAYCSATAVDHQRPNCWVVLLLRCEDGKTRLTRYFVDRICNPELSCLEGKKLRDMFFLSEIEHTLRLPPYLLNRPLNEAIKGELDTIFLDKIIEKLGLCVSVYDIRSIDGGFIFPSDGASTYTVKFRLAMFRPFEGEVISARLIESTKDGLRLSLGFFDDIYVPVPLLAAPNHFEPVPGHKDNVAWFWEFDGQNYPIDGSDEIRFRVHNVSYPPIPLEQETDSDQKAVKPFAPMVVTGSLDGDGLGPVSWW